MKVLVKNCHILPVTKENYIQMNTNLGIQDDRISFIGEVPQNFKPEMIIDGTDRLLMPGLINSHTHIAMSLLRNYADDLPFWKWLFEKIIPIEQKFTESDIYYGSLLSISEMILGGTTCFNDMYFMMDQVGKAVQESGIRAVLGVGVTGDFDKDKTIFDKSYKLYDNFHGKAQGRITTMVAPHAIYTCSESTLQRATELAQKWGTGIHIHVSESKKEIEECEKINYQSPFQYLQKIGALRSHICAAHCVQLKKKDFEILQQNDVHVLHNPTSNLKLANGFMPLKSMQRYKINIALGTDGPASNNNQNMFEEMHLASLIHKGFEQNSAIANAYEVVKMATINAAKALKLENEIGSIEPGKKADLILLNIDKPHWFPYHNLISGVVYTAQVSDVETVFIDGEMIMNNRKLQTIDFPHVKKEIQNSIKQTMG